MMAAKDKRVRLMNELLGDIRVVKFYSWENNSTSDKAPTNRRAQGTQSPKVFRRPLRLLLGHDAGSGGHSDLRHIRLDGWQFDFSQSFHLYGLIQRANKSP
jgi:hypothetical protein